MRSYFCVVILALCIAALQCTADDNSTSSVLQPASPSSLSSPAADGSTVQGSHTPEEGSSVSSVTTTTTQDAGINGNNQPQGPASTDNTDKTKTVNSNPSLTSERQANVPPEASETTTTKKPELQATELTEGGAQQPGVKVSPPVTVTVVEPNQAKPDVVGQPQDDAATTTRIQAVNTLGERTQVQGPITTTPRGELDNKGTTSTLTTPSGTDKGEGSTPPSTHTSTPITTVRQPQTNPVRPKEGDGAPTFTNQAVKEPARQTARQGPQPHLAGPAILSAPPPKPPATTGHTAPAKGTNTQTLSPATSPQLQTPITRQTPPTTAAAAKPVKTKATTSTTSSVGPAQSPATTVFGVKDKIQAQTLTSTTSTAAPTSSTQTSVTSTTEFTKTESTVPATSFRKLSQKLQQVDLKDGSTGSSSLCAFTALVTLVAMAIALAP